MLHSIPLTDLTRHGAHMLTVCNACRYCEGYCPVFPAMERRMSFGRADLAYLANLCHNCGECLYACQYAPPHEFGINVPKTLAEIRLQSYEDLCWPNFMGAAFRAHSVLTCVGMAGAFAAVLAAAVFVANPAVVWPVDGRADFYAVIPHDVMVAVFAGVSAFVLVAMGVGLVRFGRLLRESVVAAALPRTTPASPSRFSASLSAAMPLPAVPLPAAPLPAAPIARRVRAFAQAVSDAFTLRHLHRPDGDCVSTEETRRPWRRWLHHCTLYGFALCFASTSVAALYHTAFGWHAPYAYTSLPVVLGAVGGAGLLVGPLGLFVLMRRRDPAMGDPEQSGLAEGFVALLTLTSLTGLALLVLRHQPIMGPLLVLHLGTVLALFVTLPYGKFVHGFYRLAALVMSAQEAVDEAVR
jgi:citrate/tricarballylate utilization protein